MSRKGLNREGGLFQILTQSVGAYQRRGLNREGGSIQLLRYFLLCRTYDANRFDLLNSVNTILLPHSLINLSI